MRQRLRHCRLPSKTRGVALMLDKAGRANATPKHIATIACSDLRVAPLAVQRKEVALLVAVTIVTIARISRRPCDRRRASRFEQGPATGRPPHISMG